MLGEPITQAPDDARLAVYVKRCFQIPRQRRGASTNELRRTGRARLLFQRGKGNDLPGVQGTLWAAYNGIAEMVDHGANKRTPGQHLDYIWFGGGYGIKARAFTVAKHQMDTAWKAG